MMFHIHTERVRNNFDEPGFKVYLMTESFALIFKRNALDRSDVYSPDEAYRSSIDKRFTGIELHYGRNNDPNVFKQRHKPFLKLKRWGKTKPNKGLN